MFFEPTTTFQVWWIKSIRVRPHASHRWNHCRQNVVCVVVLIWHSSQHRSLKRNVQSSFMADGPRWEGKATAKVLSLSAEAAWSFLEDFCNFHKWFPAIDTCRRIEGVDGRPGLVRYCAATLPPPSEGVVKWCHERLLAMDPIGRSLSYEVLENNIGIKRYTSTMRVTAINGGDGVSGCQIEWSFLGDPVEGLTREEWVAYLDSGLQGTVRNMEDQAHFTTL
ncbi:lachrymatory-factor synthase [Andrographis paniculata]|uniref:lachrymatory-factor synthase n=1 Tax=Andrographis paniculata TaxID=175694 RepID=UPI0021E90D60|nr:lachrymatory-factor synthase [Andrographis paniculata]